jgi:hypothetical protein
MVVVLCQSVYQSRNHFSVFILVINTFLFQVHKSLQRIRERKLTKFIPWGPASIQVTFFPFLNFDSPSIYIVTYYLTKISIEKAKESHFLVRLETSWGRARHEVQGTIIRKFVLFSFPARLKIRPLV